MGAGQDHGTTVAKYVLVGLGLPVYISERKVSPTQFAPGNQLKA